MQVVGGKARMLPEMPLSSRLISRDGVYVAINGEVPIWARVNRLGYRILESCDGKHEVAEIASLISEEYGCTLDQTRQDIERFLVDAERNHLFARHEDWHQQARRDLIRNSRPQIIMLNVTNKCNLRCYYCYQNAGIPYRRELSLQDIESVMTQAVGLNPDVRLAVSGGEPFLRGDIFDILAFGASKVKNFEVLTNATLIDAHTADRIADVKNVVVQISVDGDNPVSHDTIRGRGTFEKTMNAVRLLQEREVEVTLSFTGARNNMDQIPRFFDLCDRLRIGHMRLDFVKAVGRASENDNAACLTEDEYLKAQQMVSQLHEKYGWRFSSPLDDRATVLGTFGVPRIHCGAGVSLVFIDADGSVYPCTSLNYPRLLGGNIHEMTLSEIFYNSEAFKHIRNFDINEVEACRSCFLKYICNGGCWIDGYAAHAEFAPTTHCATFKRLSEEKILEYAADSSHMPRMNGVPQVEGPV
jgi:AdoMet-dependent heme synthase